MTLLGSRRERSRLIFNLALSVVVAIGRAFLCLLRTEATDSVSASVLVGAWSYKVCASTFVVRGTRVADTFVEAIGLMRKKRTLPLNLTVFTLALVCLRAEVKAEIKPEQDHPTTGTEGGNRDATSLANVRDRIQGSPRSRTPRARLRERARRFEPYIAAASRRHGVDPRVLWTIAYLESRFRSEAVSPASARGLMQFMPGTARRFNLRNPHDSIASIDAAARYVKELTNQFGPRLDLILAGYNAGESAVECYRSGRTLRTSKGKVINRRGIRTNGVPPYKETLAYVKRGQVVFARLTSARVFTPELTEGVLLLEPVAMNIKVSERAMIERELEKAGVGPTVLFSGRKESGIGAEASIMDRPNTVGPTNGGFETVFFDVHSGTRYLVNDGKIGKALPSVDGTELVLTGRNQHVTKSLYVGVDGN